MVDIKDVVKELHRIADAGERIAKTLEKQNQILSIVPKIIAAESDEEDMTGGEN